MNLIDNATVLFCTVMAVYICMRAVKLDRMLPWFETRSMWERANKDKPAAKPKSGGKRMPALAAAAAEQPVVPWRRKTR